jgi:protochlorophyllide reductase
MLLSVTMATLYVDGFYMQRIFPSIRKIERMQSSLQTEENTEMMDNVDASNHVISKSLDRRKALTSTGLGILSLCLGTETKFPAWAEPKNGGPKTILLTGSNSGIGFEAARILARQGNTIVMACRTIEKATEAANKIKSEITNAIVIPAECNLASFDSIRMFVKDLKVDSFDVVCYNAGVALNTDDPQIQRTNEGFELTVGTNHLGHFYLHHLLLSKIKSTTGRIVITASAVHDPDSPGGAQGRTATLGNLDGFVRDGRNFEMVDGQPYNGDKAYKDSKLCNIFFCRELQHRLAASEDTKAITVNAFSPGLITSTGLFRYQSPFFSSVFGFLATNVLRVAESPQWGGAALAYMTTVDTKGEYYNSPPGSSKYGEAAFGREFTIYSVSKEAQDNAKAKKLWELSEKLVGI